MAKEVNFENLSEKLHEMRDFVLANYIPADMGGNDELKRSLRCTITILKDLSETFGIPGIMKWF